VPIHPRIAEKLHLLEGVVSFEAAMADPEQRAKLDEFMSITGAPLPPQVEIRDEAAPGPHGPVPVRVYLPEDDATDRPALVWVHGGAFVGGDLEMPEADWTARQICERANAVVVSVDYRLAPETRWQGSTTDNYAGLKWLHEHARDLGADRARIAVMGESAGGGHAALLALMARDRGEVPLVLQVLVYPMLDDRTGTSRAVPAHIGSLMWNPAANRYGWQSFLGMEPGGSSVPSQAVPARVADLAGLPPSWIGVGSIDLFVEEDIEYARRLVVAGVRTELEVVPGAFHGFDMDAAGSSVAAQFRSAKLNALRRAFGMSVCDIATSNSENTFECTSSLPFCSWPTLTTNSIQRKTTRRMNGDPKAGMDVGKQSSNDASTLPFIGTA